MRLPVICLGILSGAIKIFAADPDLPNLWKTWITRADTLHHQGNLAGAAESGKHALGFAKGFDRSDPRLPTTYYVLGSIYRDWGHCAESRSNYLHAIALFEKQPNPKPRYVFNTAVGLVSEAAECDDFVAAEKFFKDHAAALQRYGSGPLDEAKIMALQAALSRGRKHYAEAENHYRKTVQLLEQTQGSKPADIAELRSSMAVVINAQGRHEEALAESRKTVAMLENISPRYVTLPAALNNEACALAQLGRMEEAGRVYQRALDLAREIYGEDNRNTAKIMMNYAALLRDNKETPAADTLKKKGVEAYRRSLLQDRGTVDVEQLKSAK